jgi:hypothetical protein
MAKPTESCFKSTHLIRYNSPYNLPPPNMYGREGLSSPNLLALGGVGLRPTTQDDWLLPQQLAAIALFFTKPSTRRCYRSSAGGFGVGELPLPAPSS